VRQLIGVHVMLRRNWQNLKSNSQLINVHLDGLSHAIGGVDGLVMLQHLPVIWLMIYWYDSAC
jgi:hypothetical protein